VNSQEGLWGCINHKEEEEEAKEEEEAEIEIHQKNINNY